MAGAALWPELCNVTLRFLPAFGWMPVLVQIQLTGQAGSSAWGWRGLFFFFFFLE